MRATGHPRPQVAPVACLATARAVPGAAVAPKTVLAASRLEATGGARATRGHEHVQNQNPEVSSFSFLTPRFFFSCFSSALRSFFPGSAMSSPPSAPAPVS